MRRLFLVSLALLTLCVQPVSALDASDAEPPQVDSIRLLMAPKNPASPFAVVEFAVSDDKNWVSGSIRLGLGHVPPNTLVPACRVSASYQDRSLLVEHRAARSEANGRKSQVFWQIISFNPTLIELPSGCPEWRLPSTLTLQISVNLWDEARRNVSASSLKSITTPYGIDPTIDQASVQSGLQQLVSQSPTRWGCAINANDVSPESRLILEKRALDLEQVLSRAQKDLPLVENPIPTNLRPEAARLLGDSRKAVLGLVGLLRQDLLYTKFMLEPSLAAVESLPTCSFREEIVQGPFIGPESPYTDSGAMRSIATRLPAILVDYQRLRSRSIITSRTTITCVKGNQTKKVLAVAPKCPAGWRQR